jgi:ABC-type transport system involved in multi-copper enzyme maturation permease subunit
VTLVDQSYQPWSGDFQPRWRRIAAMVRIGMKQAFAGTAMRILLFLVYAVMIAIVGVVFVLSSSKTPIAAVQGNGIFKLFLGNMFPSGILLMALGAIVGGRLISRDLRYNAVSMYFSKAITRGDYLAGKLLTLSAFLASATFLPALLLWASQWSLSTETVPVGTRLLDLLAILGHSAAFVLPCAMFILALSSFSRTAFVPAVLWVTTYIGSAAVSEVLVANVVAEWCALLSWSRHVMRVGEACYPVRQVKAGPFDVEIGTAPLSMNYPVWVPLTVLGTITVLSAIAVLWRLRKFEGAD